MKATGIVRRIDDLGRVAIPKEIRRTLSIHADDPLEIWTDGKDTLCLRKYTIDLRDEIEGLKDQLVIASNLSYEDQSKAAALLNEVLKLVIKSEE